MVRKCGRRYCHTHEFKVMFGQTKISTVFLFNYIINYFRSCTQLSPRNDVNLLNVRLVMEFSDVPFIVMEVSKMFSWTN